MIEYRRFRNTDPPGLVAVWNDAFKGRGAVRLRNSSPLERFTFSKLYFDPEGLIIAVDDGRPVGFVHAGFGANADGAALDTTAGVICLMAVCPACQGRGIGTELLRRSEDYLRARGSQRLCAGQHRPVNPFYLGLYGGSEMPGFLASDAQAEPFFTRRGYQVCRTIRVLQRRLNIPIKIFDARFIGFRQRYELQEDAFSRLDSWWSYNTFNGAEPRVFSLIEKGAGKWAARVTVWEMDGFGCRWDLPAVGLVDLCVRPDLRKQGLAKFLLAQMLRRAQEELLEVMELQVAADNQAALKLCQAVGFEQVDLGKVYQRGD